MKPIQVTTEVGTPIWLNPNHIRQYSKLVYPGPEVPVKSIIEFQRYEKYQEDYLEVQETPDELTRLLVCAN